MKSILLLVALTLSPFDYGSQVVCTTDVNASGEQSQTLLKFNPLPHCCDVHLNLHVINDCDCDIGNERALHLGVPTCDLGTVTIWIYFVIGYRKMWCPETKLPR